MPGNKHKPFIQSARKYRTEKACHSLAGILEGIVIDNQINPLEIEYLKIWLADHKDISSRAPFNELTQAVSAALEDGVIDNEERADILWLCHRFSTNGDGYDFITTDLQHLQGILTGILADGTISKLELEGLKLWIEENNHLECCWPYDEINAVVSSVMVRKKLNEEQHKALISLFADFSLLGDDRTITNPPVKIENFVTGVCSLCPEVTFRGRSFCFTGTSSVMTRNQLKKVVENLGGRCINSVSSRLDYLVIGAEGNPCWAYACYGRKVETAVRLRKEGHQVQLIHENDFHDSVADYG
jgi:NAD-dependent DNA ligase